MNIPAELQERPQCVVWKYGRLDKTGKTTKLPYDPKNGRMAKANDPATWGTFDQATRSQQKYRYAGIGFVFSENDPFCGIDLDHCFDPATKELLPWAREIVERMNTYTEITPSGNGLHLILKAKLSVGHNRKDAIEMYDQLRYFTMTGQVFEGHATIEERQVELDELFRETFKDESAKVLLMQPNRGPAQVPSDIIERAKSARNGDKFSKLWAGDTSGYASPSEADQALCNMLAFWCRKDPGQIDTLFRQSGLYREKLERQDYRDRTISRAIEQCKEVYEPQQQHPESKPAKAAQETPWPEPEPIQTTLRPVETLPTGIIPEPLRGWSTDAAHRMQCPHDFVAVAAIVEAGAVIGAGCGIRPKQKDTWLAVPNLWGGVVARPSKMKSPALDEGIKPTARLEAEAKNDHDQALADWEADNEAYKAKKEAVKGDMAAAAKGKAKRGEKVPDMAEAKAEYTALEEPETPARRRYKTSDSTIEKMAVILNENPRGILVFRDELVGLLVNWDREDRQADRAFYLEAWGGQGSYTADRIGRGTIDTPNLCVSILGGMQPSKLTGYLLQANDDLQNDGLLQRFQLLVYPDELKDWKYIDQQPDFAAKDRAFMVFKTLAEMDFTQHGAELPEGEKIPFLHFDNEAQELFKTWLTELEEKIKNEGTPLIAEHLSKYRSLMPSLALIFHLINVADGQPGGSVTELATMQAAAWCDYLESHARRIYGLLADISVRAAEVLAERIKKRELADGFTLRDVYRNCWHLLDKKEIVEQACDELVEAGWLREVISSEGQTRALYYINPNIFPSNEQVRD